MSLIAKLTQKWQPEYSVREAIIENISHLLTSRAPIWQIHTGEPINLPNILCFGMQNLATTRSKSNSEAILGQIQTLIANYEPRVHDVEIELIADTQQINKLSFRITAIIASQHAEKIVFDVRNSHLV